MKNCRRWLAFKKSLSKHLQENLQKPLCEFQTRSLITSADFLKSKLGRVEEHTILFVVQLEKLECSDMRLKIAILKFGFFSSTLCLTVTRLLDSIPLNSSSLYSMPILIMSLLLLYEKKWRKRKEELEKWGILMMFITRRTYFMLSHQLEFASMKQWQLDILHVFWPDNSCLTS